MKIKKRSKLLNYFLGVAILIFLAWFILDYFKMTVPDGEYLLKKKLDSLTYDEIQYVEFLITNPKKTDLEKGEVLNSLQFEEAEKKWGKGSFNIIKNKYIQNPDIIKKAQTLPDKGILKVINMPNNERYVYLKIDDMYISELQPLLKRSIPKLESNIGAHITVVENIYSKLLPEVIPEIGEEFTFTITGPIIEAELVKKSRFLRNEKFNKITYYILLVDSPELDAFRKKYNIPKTSLNNFHITFAQEKKPIP
jgi:hypothetical protein